MKDNETKTNREREKESFISIEEKIYEKERVRE
jgi:hypothetical protein